MGYSYLAIEDCCNTWYGTDLNQCLRKEDPVDGAVEGGWYVNWQKVCSELHSLSFVVIFKDWKMHL